MRLVILGQSRKKEGSLSTIKAILFDMDGTVFDVPYNWSHIKTRLNTGGEPVLSFLNRLKEPERSQKWRILIEIEKKATQKAVLKEGIKSLMAFLKKKKVRTALVTNNSMDNVRYLINKFGLSFDRFLSRESGLWKPSGAPLLAVIKDFQLNPEDCCAVGDSLFDVRAAKEAGIPHVFILGKDGDAFSALDVKVFSSVSTLQHHLARLFSTPD
ncbi:MAG: HAD family phosphatase [Candidatus Aminicenantes bacterium]|nr:HAD family phosphatase [Candidatus Aminicenantes bacterium]